MKLLAALLLIIAGLFLLGPADAQVGGRGVSGSCPSGQVLQRDGTCVPGVGSGGVSEETTGSGGGPSPPPGYTPALQFNDARNSQYLGLGFGWK